MRHTLRVAWTLVFFLAMAIAPPGAGRARPIAIPANARAAGAPAMGTWSEISSVPTPRRLLAAAAVGGQIYTFGGCGSPCFEPPLHTDTFEETLVEVYDVATGVWSRPPHSIPAILFGAAAAAYPAKGLIYTFGGYLTGSLVLEYNPATDAWASRSPMLTPRYGLAAVTLDDGKIYVLGGSGPSAALEVYDPASDHWSRLASMPTARVFLAAAAIKGKIYALGGSPDAAGGSQTAALEVYDVETGRWAERAPLPVAEQLSAAVALNDKIYAFGGFVPGSGVRAPVYEYDPVADSWTVRAQMPVARDQAPAAVANGLAFVLGGSIDCHCRALSTAESYTPPPGPPPPPTPCVTLAKTDDLATAAPGDTLSYQLRVTNCSAAAEAVTVSDPFNGTGLLGGRWCRGAGCLPSAGGDLRDTRTLAAGEQEVYTIAGTVPCGTGPGPSSLVNEACAKVAGLAPVCQADAHTVAPPTADLDIAGRATLAVAAGETISYHWLVRNLGPCPAQDVVLEQPLGALLPDALQPSSPHPGGGKTKALPPGACPPEVTCTVSPGSGVFSCQLGTLAASCSVPVAFRLRVPCNQPAVNLSETATVTSVTPDVTPDPSRGDDSFTVVTAVAVRADYSIVKSCPAVKVAGETIDYTLTVANAGPSCPEVVVTDMLPPPVLGPLRCPGAACLPGIWSFKITPPPGGAETFSLEGSIDAAFFGFLTNTASVETVPRSDPVLPNNSSTCITQVSQPPKPCGVTGSCFVSGPFIPGATVTYTYVLTNSCLQPQPDNSGPEFIDTLPAELTLVGATADSGTVTTTADTVSWDGSIPASGTVTIMVTAMIKANATGTVCNQGTVFFVGDDGKAASAEVGPCCQPLSPQIPVLSGGALAGFALLLAALAVARLAAARRSSKSNG